MTRQIYDELDLLSQFWKKYPCYFNDWEKQFAQSLLVRFKEYHGRTLVTDPQANKLNSLVTKLQAKLEKDLIG